MRTLLWLLFEQRDWWSYIPDRLGVKAKKVDVVYQTVFRAGSRAWRSKYETIPGSSRSRGSVMRYISRRMRLWVHRRGSTSGPYTSNRAAVPSVEGARSLRVWGVALSQVLQLGTAGPPPIFLCVDIAHAHNTWKRAAVLVLCGLLALLLSPFSSMIRATLSQGKDHLLKRLWALCTVSFTGVFEFYVAFYLLRTCCSWPGIRPKADGEWAVSHGKCGS